MRNERGLPVLALHDLDSQLQESACLYWGSAWAPSGREKFARGVGLPSIVLRWCPCSASMLTWNNERFINSLRGFGEMRWREGSVGDPLLA